MYSFNSLSGNRVRAVCSEKSDAAHFFSTVLYESTCAHSSIRQLGISSSMIRSPFSMMIFSIWRFSGIKTSPIQSRQAAKSSGVGGGRLRKKDPLGRYFERNADHAMSDALLME